MSNLHPVNSIKCFYELHLCLSLGGIRLGIVPGGMAAQFLEAELNPTPSQPPS